MAVRDLCDLAQTGLVEFDVFPPVEDIAERIGDRATLCVVSGNLCVLARRLGDVPGAETWYRRAIALAEQIADPIMVLSVND